MTLKSSRLVISTTLAWLLNVGAADASCSIYEHANYAGWRKDIGGGAGWTYVGGSANDKASSIKLARGCRFVAYADSQYRGQSWTFNSDTPFVGAQANDKISSGKCLCNVQIEVGPTVQATIERTLPRALDAYRGGLDAKLKGELGRGNLIGPGFTLYNLNPRIGRATVKVLDQKSLTVSLTDNYIYAKVTQPTAAGSYADPAFEVRFDFTMTERIDLPNGKPQLASGGLTVTRLSVTGRNLVGNAAVLVARFFGAGERGRQILERELRANIQEKLRGPLNEALVKVRR